MKVYLKKKNFLIPYSSCSNKLTRGLTVLPLTLFTSHGYASALYVPETANPTDTAFAGAGIAAIAGGNGWTGAAVGEVAGGVIGNIEGKKSDQR